MIWESGPWKQDLLRTVTRCEREFSLMGRAVRPTEWQQAVRYQRLEKAVFLTAFIVRKLAESRRLSMQAEAVLLPVTVYRAKEPGRSPDSMHTDQIERYYELEEPEREDVRLFDLVNRIIHSHVFAPELMSDNAGGEHVVGFYVNSDRNRADRVVRVPWAVYRQALDRIAGDDVVEFRMIRDGRGREVQVRSDRPLTRKEVEDFERRARASNLWPPGRDAQ